MPKLPHLSGTEIIRVLERFGFSKVRQNGSHVVLRNGTRGCVVPLHREVKIGTLSGILRQSGITAEDFLENGL
jgi:predicted RNA binding protein YcfA (HicA-like mRNA interferase family)